MTTLHTEVLKPCPFCGGPAHAIQEEYPEEWWVGCKTNACVSTGIHLGIDEAIATWNTRTPQPDAAAIRQAAYQTGWEECSRWAKRSDLIADIDSLAYEHDRDVALSTTLVEPAIPTPSDAIRSETQDAPLAINVPKGYVLIPIEPTCVLVEAGYAHHYRLDTTLGRQKACADYAQIVRTALAIAASPAQSKDA